jgi:glucose-6-phosphate 1-epimerase
MSSQQLPSLERFAVAGRVSLEESPSGFTRCNLYHPSGTSATLYTYGAHVTGFVAQGKEVLFMSKQAIFAKGTALRGGIPICWPQFSGRGKLPAHGFARTAEWQLLASGISSSGQTLVKLGLCDSEQTRSVWPHAFALEYEVALGKDLQLVLHVKNTGSASFSFGGALHSYFQVGSVKSSYIEGLSGLMLLDFLKDNVQSHELREKVEVQEHNDRCYLQAPTILKIHDQQNKRVIQLSSENFPDAVLWNPWSERCKQIKDLGAADYLQFLCLESGIVETPTELAAGKELVLKQKIEVLPA